MLLVVVLLLVMVLMVVQVRKVDAERGTERGVLRSDVILQCLTVGSVLHRRHIEVTNIHDQSFNFRVDPVSSQFDRAMQYVLCEVNSEVEVQTGQTTFIRS